MFTIVSLTIRLVASCVKKAQCGVTITFGNCSRAWLACSIFCLFSSSYKDAGSANPFKNACSSGKTSRPAALILPLASARWLRGRIAAARHQRSPVEGATTSCSRWLRPRMSRPVRSPDDPSGMWIPGRSVPLPPHAERGGGPARRLTWSAGRHV